MKILLKLFLVLMMSTIVNASNSWVPQMMGNTSVTINSVANSYPVNATVSVNIGGQLSGEQDWAAIYRVGDNNDWGNVIAWNWVRNGTTELNIIKHAMPLGEYEVRLFFHNSYAVEATHRFTVVPDGASTEISTTKDQYIPNERVSVRINGQLSGDQDWAAIYRVGDNNDWGNVIAWNWVRNGTTELNIIKHAMPLGEYEVRLFFHNSYAVEARHGFTVESNGREFGTEGPYLNRVKSVKTSEGGKVTNAIYYVEGVNNLPTVIFMSGWKSNLNSYDGFLKYVASLGYCVIAKQERGECFTPSVYHQELTDRLNMVHNTYHADISKLGIIGHSSGGGVVHNLMHYFKSHNIAGNRKNVVMSLDGWFPFGTTEAMLNAFDTPTLLMQFGGNDGRNTNGTHPDWDDYAGQPYHHYQDPKINLAIFQSLTRANVDKEYIVLEANNNHSYFAGTYASLITKRDFLAPVDEFLNHTIGRGDAMNLMDNSGEVITNDLASEYQYYCHTAGFNFCDLDMLVFP